jgi:hypothetical protein
VNSLKTLRRKPFSPKVSSGWLGAAILRNWSALWQNDSFVPGAQLGDEVIPPISRSDCTKKPLEIRRDCYKQFQWLTRSPAPHQKSDEIWHTT